MASFVSNTVSRARAAQAKAAIRTLLEKDDALLDDIGYTRAALEWAARQADASTALQTARRMSRPLLRTPQSAAAAQARR